MKAGGRLSVAVGVPLAVALGVGIWLGVVATGGSGASTSGIAVQHFRSRPDLTPPQITILHGRRPTAPGYVFLAPKKKVPQAGPLILDNHGHVVWFDPLRTKGVADFKVQRYRGKPVLTWWQGTVAKGGHADTGGYEILDSSYRLIRVVRAGNGLTGDIHEFQITPQGTALMTIFNKVRANLSRLGGPRHGYVLEGVVQEVSLKTGRVLFEWHSLEHVAPSESYEKLGKKGGRAKTPYDYFHINSIAVDGDGSLLVSARHTSTVYKIARPNGKVVWRLGGRKSSFTLGPGARFAFQHDARRQPNGTITVFDNAAKSPTRGAQSRVLELRVDSKTHRAAVVHAYVHDPPLLSQSQGDGQFLPDGHVFVGWGQNPLFTEFSASGKTLLDAKFGDPKAGNVDSYRAFRFRWVGRPATRPAAVLHGGAVYVSWNGATQVARWQVRAGGRTVASSARRGFETAIKLRSARRGLTIRALDAHGHVLGSAPVRGSSS